MPFKPSSKNESFQRSEKQLEKTSSASLRRVRSILSAFFLSLASASCAHTPSTSAVAIPAAPVNVTELKEGKVKKKPKSKKESKERGKSSGVPDDSPCKEYENTADYINCCLWHWECELANLTTDDEAADEQLAM